MVTPRPHQKKKKMSLFSPQGDAGLADHLRAQVLGGELERRLHQPQLLQEAIELSGAGQQERAHLLQLEEEEETEKKSKKQEEEEESMSGVISKR